MPAQDTAPTYKIITWGCQMNVEDSEQIALHLNAVGMRPAAQIAQADVILLNTCSVRRKPEEKAFSMLGELRKLKAERPELLIGVCGCMAQLRADEIHKRAPHVDFIVGTANVSQIPTLMREARQARKFQTRLELPPRTGAVVTSLPQRMLPETNGHLNSTSTPSSPPKIKAFVPIQYGCDKFCTFCIVPATRGRERSRPTQDILNEIRMLADRGVKEVTLLGQTVNSYGKNLLEGKVPFAQLLWKIAEIQGIERIRYTSPYPRDYRDDLITVHRNCPKVMPHVHLPLQSGDDDILKAMRRAYTVDSFKDIYRRLRQEIPTMAITTDVIVGFPGETERQFENTLRVMSELRFDAAFMFAYSPRPGTPAAAMPQLPHDVKRRRLHELIQLQNRITCEINQSEVGSLFEVLVEGRSEKNQATFNAKGLTRHGKTVHLHSEASPGTLVQVTPIEAHLWGFLATAA